VVQKELKPCEDMAFGGKQKHPISVKRKTSSLVSVCGNDLGDTTTTTTTTTTTSTITASRSRDKFYRPNFVTSTSTTTTTTISTSTTTTTTNTATTTTTTTNTTTTTTTTTTCQCVRQRAWRFACVGYCGSRRSRISFAYPPHRAVL
jgi:hypothetical protein